MHFFWFLISCVLWGQQSAYVDFKTAKVHIEPNPQTNVVNGNVEYNFIIKMDLDSVYLDAKNMDIEKVLLDGQESKYTYDSKRLTIQKEFSVGENHKIFISYRANPKKAFYVVEKEGGVQVWTQGQGKYTSNWLPSLDDTNDKIEFDVSITFDKGYEVISNGKLVKKESNTSLNTWHYDMQHEMSSYLVALAIGRFNKIVEYSKTGIPLEMYFYPKDSLKAEPTYRYTKQMFDFLEEEIGIAYPWQNYKQVPVHDFLYAGMENTTCTIFSDAFMTDSIAFVDKNYVNVNAHELAHQWFGDFVTAKSEEHHWLQEGFATYYALLAEREIFGDDYYYWKLHEYALELLQQDKEGLSTSLLNPKSSSLTFYKKGAWVLHLLSVEIGESAFKTAVKNYLMKHQFGNVDSMDFFMQLEKASGKQLNDFVKIWLESKDLQFDTMLDVLKEDNESIRLYYEVDCESIFFKCKQIIEETNNKYLKINILNKINSNLISKSFFQETDVKFRQGLAKKLVNIPFELKEEYESLLDDDSYLTKEIALYNLWNNFPEDQNKYLDKTKNTIGFNDRNVRILWLVLALSTPDYEPEKSQHFFNELISYTSKTFDFETRLRAFEYLLFTNSCNADCLYNLKEATYHHNWRLAKFANDQLKLLNPNQE